MDEDNQDGKVMMGDEDRAADASRDASRRAKKGKSQIQNDVTVVKRIVTIVATIILLIILFGGLTTGIIVKTTQKNKVKTAPQVICDLLEVDDLYEFVEIQGNDDTGFYLEFVEEADKKIADLVKELKLSYAIKNINADLLKRMIKAEVVTQYPFLRGTGSMGSSYSRKYSSRKSLELFDFKWIF